MDFRYVDVIRLAKDRFILLNSGKTPRHLYVGTEAWMQLHNELLTGIDPDLAVKLTAMFGMEIHWNHFMRTPFCLISEVPL